MAQRSTQNRIFASLTALSLICILLSSVVLTSHHHHENHHHDEENCIVCQLIETTLTALRNTLSTPTSNWSVFILFAPFLLIASPLFAVIAPDTLVAQKTRCNN